MKKTFKFIPLAIAPALLLMACANVASNDNNGLLTDTHNPSSDNASNASGITEYKVTVDFNGGLYKGESSYDFSVKKGTAYQYFKKNLPQEVGTDLVYADHELSFYSFDTGSSAAEIEDTYRFMGDITIHAIYTPVDPSTTYTVTWLNNDGSTVLLKEENKYHKSELPSYSGATPTPINPIEGVTYEFDGWTTPITPISDADQTYIAKYKETIVNTSTILFETDGGDSIPSMTLPVGTVLNKTDVPTAFKFGYVFQGWYLTSTQEVQYPYTVPDEDPIYFVAHYLPQLIEVSFDPAGGKWSDESTGVKKQKFNYNSMPFYTEDPTKEGSIFTGWSPKLVPVTEDAPKAYTATWESAPVPTTTYTISFDAAGGTPVAAQVIEAGQQIATKPATSRTGYSTYDWYDGDNKVTFPYTPTANKTLVAHWTADKYDITFKPNGGTWSDSGTTDKVIPTEYGTMPSPGEGITISRAGYAFTGWSPALSPVTGATSYTAQWVEITTYYTVTFDTQGGTNVVSQQIASGGKVTDPGESATTKTGYAFQGWYKEASCTNVWNFNTDTVSGNTTIYAKWEITLIAITFKPNGGKWSDGYTTDKVIPTEYGTMPSPGEGITISKTGYTFNGWSPTLRPVAKTADVYEAQWIANDYTVTFYDSNGADKLYEIPVEYNTKVNKPKDPTAPTEKVFDKWVTTKGGDTEFNFDTPITGNTSVYASYADKKYTIRWFNADAARTPLETDTNNVKGDMPTYDGPTPTLAPDLNHRYKFSGWSPTILPVDADMSYYATYDYDDEINLTYTSNTYPLEGELDFATTFNYGGVVMYSFGMVDLMAIEDSLMVSIDGGTKYPVTEFGGEISVAASGKNAIVLIQTGPNSTIGSAHNISMEIIL